MRDPRLTCPSGLTVISLAAALALGIGASAAAELAHKPTRIVSINLCTDELVLRLADPRNVVSVSYLSRNYYSNVIDLAENIPVNHGLAEEIVPLRPDLVVSGLYTARTAAALLKRTNIPILDLDVPRTIQEVMDQYRDVGEALGEPERARRIVDEIEERIAAMPPAPPPLPRALVFNLNGFTIRKRSLEDDIITRAGMEDLSRTFGIERYGQISLETVVTSKVDVLILSQLRDRPPAIGSEVLRHPVLDAVADRTRQIVVPSKLWICAGPENVDAIDLLRGVATEVRREAASR